MQMSEEKEYWFVCYMWKRTLDREWNYDNALVEGCYMEWLLDSPSETETYNIISVVRTTKEKFDRFDGYIG